MATNAELNLARQQLAVVLAQRDEAIAQYDAAVADYRRLEALVTELLAINKQQGSQVDRLMTFIESSGMGSFGDRSGGAAGPSIH